MSYPTTRWQAAWKVAGYFFGMMLFLFVAVFSKVFYVVAALMLYLLLGAFAEWKKIVSNERNRRYDKRRN